MNNIMLVLQIIQRLKHKNIDVWLFGGWAEELLHMIPPKNHHDIDLLYSASSFHHVEHFIQENKDIQEIPGKRFVHK